MRYEPVATPERYYQFIQFRNEEEVRKHGNTAQRLRTPLFLTQRGNIYQPHAFRQTAWSPALQAAGMYARPHQIRHWFVTLVLIRIEQTYRLDRPNYRAARLAFGRYMGWKNVEAMLAVYDRALERHGMQEQWPLVAQYAESQLFSTVTDFRSFIEEMEALSPEERQTQADVDKTFSDIQDLLPHGDADE